MSFARTPINLNLLFFFFLVCLMKLQPSAWCLPLSPHFCAWCVVFSLASVRKRCELRRVASYGCRVAVAIIGEGSLANRVTVPVEPAAGKPQRWGGRGGAVVAGGRNARQPYKPALTKVSWFSEHNLWHVSLIPTFAACMCVRGEVQAAEVGAKGKGTERGAHTARPAKDVTTTSLWTSGISL